MNILPFIEESALSTLSGEHVEQSQVPRQPVGMTALGSTLSGGIAAISFWLVVNSFVKIDHKGLLDHLSLPVWAFPLFIAMGAILGCVFGCLAVKRERKRVAGMADCAAALDLNFALEATQSQLGVAETSLFPNWKMGTNWFHGIHDRRLVNMIDITELRDTSDAGPRSASPVSRRTVIVLAAEGLPDFDARPVRFSDRVLDLLGITRPPFDLASLPTDQAGEAVPRFLRSWRLSSYDLTMVLASGKLEAPEIAAGESAVWNLFSPRLMDLLEPFQGWSIRVRQGKLALWRGNGFVTAESRVALLGDAYELFAVLQSEASSTASHEALLDRPLATTRQRAQRLVGASLGGVIGLAVGFFGGFFGSFLFQLPQRLKLGARFHLINTLLIPLTTFGGAALGGLMGVLVGCLISSMIKLPTDQQISDGRSNDIRSRIRVRMRWRILGAVAGWSLGCVGVAVGAKVLDLVVGMNRIPQQVLAPLLFLCPVGCLVGGWIVAGRVSRRREKALSRRA